MNKFIETIKNIFSIKELRDKIIFTLGILLIYRLGSHITLPGINPAEILSMSSSNDSSSGIQGLLASFTGGGFSRASILALGIMPYISASIVVQLMGFAVPYVQKMQNDGESGRRKINQITRYLTIAISFVQAPAYLIYLQTYMLPYDPSSMVYIMDPNSLWFVVSSVLILVSGTIFTMWLGEIITDKGIGNGVSLIIMFGIVAGLPASVFNEVQDKDALFLLLEVLLFFVIVLFSILLIQAVRKVAINYVGRAKMGSSNFMTSMKENTVRQYIPLKVNASGVMPIIFAQAIMFVPGLLTKVAEDNDFINQLQEPFSWPYNTLLATLIIVFTFLYTAITINTNDMAENLRKNGGVIPKVKPGIDTANFLDVILSRITLPGSILLALIAILPAFIAMLGVSANLALFFGGTSLLIMVGVILDTSQQINTYLLNHHYDGLMQTSGKSKRNLEF